MAAKRRKGLCKGKTRSGKRCGAWPLKGTERCAAHPLSPGSAGFGSSEQAAEAGKLGGRPRLPRPHEVLRERIEANIDRWLKPYEDALEANRAVVVAGGSDEKGEQLPSRVELVPDHRARMRAAREPLDRVYGKPRQQVELGGSETPIRAEIVAVDDSAVADAAHDFLRRIAGGAEPGG